MATERFAGYRTVWFGICVPFAQALLVFIVSGEKSSVIVIGLPLYVT